MRMRPISWTAMGQKRGLGFDPQVPIKSVTHGQFPTLGLTGNATEAALNSSKPNFMLAVDRHGQPCGRNTQSPPIHDCEAAVADEHNGQNEWYQKRGTSQLDQFSKTKPTKKRAAV